jgi:hypothetical protein
VRRPARRIVPPREKSRSFRRSSGGFAKIIRRPAGQGWQLRCRISVSLPRSNVRVKPNRVVRRNPSANPPGSPDLSVELGARLGLTAGTPPSMITLSRRPMRTSVSSAGSGPDPDLASRPYEQGAASTAASEIGRKSPRVAPGRNGLAPYRWRTEGSECVRRSGRTVERGRIRRFALKRSNGGRLPDGGAHILVRGLGLGHIQATSAGGRARRCRGPARCEFASDGGGVSQLPKPV